MTDRFGTGRVGRRKARSVDDFSAGAANTDVGAFGRCGVRAVADRSAGMQREVLLERFFNALISGARPAARAVVDELLEADCSGEKILTRLFWPTLNHIQNLFRNDQLSDVAYHYATRLLRVLVDQTQPRLEQSEPRGRLVMVVTGDETSEEIAGQIVTDMLEANGYEVIFAGGGIANDELVSQTNSLEVDCLVIFGAVSATVPETRQLIDRLQTIGANEKMQVIVGGGVFNRAPGLSEEIGADLWAQDPEELVSVMDEFPERRMSHDQRTVGRKRRNGVKDASAA